MSGGETSLSGYDNASQALSYTPGQEQVYLNGILLVRGDDYTATNGTSITGLSALAASDFVQVNCYNNFSVASVPTTSLTGTVSNAQLANSAITINGSAISLGGTVTLAGDIESVTATSPLTGGGSTGALTVGIQSASTTQSGAVQLSDSTSTTSSVLAATPTAVKSAYDLANGAIPKTLTTTTGDIIYASSANTPARLGIGSTDQILKVSGGVPTWATPAVPSGGLNYVTGATFSGVSSVDLPNNTFTTTYRNYQIYIDFSSGTGGSTFQIRVRKDGVTTSSAIYEYGNMNVNRGGSVTGVGGNGDTAWRLGYSNYFDRGANVITVYNPKASGQKITVTGSVGTGDGVNGQAGGMWQGSITGIDSLNFSISSGTMSGTYRVYGLGDA
jgi:hypothetical protein